MAHLSLSFDGAVAILTLSGPLNNRFGVEVVDDLDNAIDELIAKEARAVLLCADGPDFSHRRQRTGCPSIFCPCHLAGEPLQCPGGEP